MKKWYKEIAHDWEKQEKRRFAIFITILSITLLSWVVVFTWAVYISLQINALWFRLLG
jgi:hypothetical protein